MFKKMIMIKESMMKNLVIRKAIGEDLSNIMEIKKQVHDLYIEKRPDIYKKMRFYTRKHF